MAIIRNARVSWVKCDQNNPDLGFDGDSPAWSIDVEKPSEEIKKIWAANKLGGLKTRKETGDEYLVIKRKAAPFKNGDQKESPTVVDGHLKPLDPNLVGNGSIVNVQYNIYDWEFKGRKGKSADLSGIQVINLVAREGAISEFEMVDDSTPFVPDEGDDDSIF
jgi:hypothetical protein